MVNKTSSINCATQTWSTKVIARLNPRTWRRYIDWMRIKHYGNVPFGDGFIIFWWCLSRDCNLDHVTVILILWQYLELILTILPLRAAQCSWIIGKLILDHLQVDSIEKTPWSARRYRHHWVYQYLGYIATQIEKEIMPELTETGGPGEEYTSDEDRFVLHTADGRTCVWRSRWTGYAQLNMEAFVLVAYYGLWMPCYGCKMDLVTLHGTLKRSKISKYHLGCCCYSSYEKSTLANRPVFMNDNAQVHLTIAVLDYLKRNVIETIP